VSRFRPFVPAVVIAVTVLSITAVAIMRPPGEQQWLLGRIVATVVGGVSFVVAAVLSSVYLQADRRLRKGKAGTSGETGAVLTGFESWMSVLLPVGLGMMTASVVCGMYELARPVQDGGSVAWHSQPRMVIGVCAWVICAVALQVAYARRFHGRQVAAMSLSVMAMLVMAAAAAAVVGYL